MPMYIFRCDNCGIETPIRFATWKDSDMEHRCACGGLLVKQPSAPSFVIRGFAEKNGYAK